MESLGRYRLVRSLGRGGMAEVFEAVAVAGAGVEKPVVLKRILREHASDPDFRTMFFDEARVAMRLAHPNVVQVFDFGGDDQPYLVMELIRGRDLSTVLHRAHGPLPVDVAIYIAAQTARGLDHAHRLADPSGKTLGVVHRDVSPQNVLVSWDGNVKIGDFGIASFANRTSHTATGFVRGKVRYMSPEQAGGGALDARSDLFSLGVVLWEMLTGRDAFQDTNDLAILQAIQRVDLPPPSEIAPVPPALEAIVLRELSADAALRHPTARDFSNALESFAAGAGLAGGEDSLRALLPRLFPDEAPRTVEVPHSDGAPAQPRATTAAREPTSTDGRAAVRSTAPSRVVPAVVALAALVTGAIVAMALPSVRSPGTAGRPSFTPTAAFLPAGPPGILQPAPTMPATPAAGARRTSVAEPQPSGGAAHVRTPAVPAPTAGAPSPGLTGEWSSSTPGSSATWASSALAYDFSIRLSGASGTTEYPTLGCRGELRLTHAAPPMFTYAESIAQGAAKCVTGGEIRIEHRPDGSLDWTWSGRNLVDGKPIVERATLTRKRAAPSGENCSVLGGAAARDCLLRVAGTDLERGRFLEARSSYRRAAEIDPFSEEAEVGRGKAEAACLDLARSRIISAKAYISASNYREARKELDLALKFADQSQDENRKARELLAEIKRLTER